jgi:DNA-binding CsgD family transcriptional regulator
MSDRNPYNPPSDSDYRPYRAAQCETIKSRSKLLSQTDRTLVDLILEGHCKNADMAALLGISESSLSHRIRRLTKFLGQPCFTFFRQSHQLGPDQWKVIRMAFLHGRSIRQIVRQTGLSRYRTQKIIAEFKRPNQPEHENHIH